MTNLVQRVEKGKDVKTGQQASVFPTATTREILNPVVCVEVIKGAKDGFFHNFDPDTGLPWRIVSRN